MRRPMNRVSFVSRCTIGVATIMSFAAPARAQSDSAGRMLALSVAAGPSFAIGSLRNSSGVGYAIQGSVSIRRKGSPLSLRGDVVYQHGGSGMENLRSTADGVYEMRGDAVASAIVFGNAVVAAPPVAFVKPYLLAGVGAGWPDGMSMMAGAGQSPSSTSFAWQSGGGVEIAFGERRLSVEARIQSLRSPRAARWYTMLPITFGVAF